MAVYDNPSAELVIPKRLVAFETYVRTNYSTYRNFTYEVHAHLHKISRIEVPSITDLQMTSLVADLQLQFPLLF